MNILFPRCAVLALISAAAFTLHSDTLSQQAASDTGIAAFAGADSPSTGSTAPAPAQKLRHEPQHVPKTDAKGHRDSTLRNLLATLAKEDSLNALSQHETASVSETRKDRKTASGKTSGIAGGFAKITGQLVWTARHRPWLSIAEGAAVLFIILWFVAARLAGKKAEKRFMTTTRLSLMDGEVRRACLHIEKHYADTALTPGIVCAAIVTGEPFLEALFQRELGMSIADYIIQARIHHAKQIVRENPAVDAPAVASQVGFSNVALFITLFKNLTGHDFNVPQKR